MSSLRYISRLPANVGRGSHLLGKNTQSCYWPSQILLRSYSPAQHLGSKPPNEDPSCFVKEKKTSSSTECPKKIQKLDPIVRTSSGIGSKASVKDKLNAKSVRKNVEGYVNTRYFDYLTGYNSVLEKNFPSAVKVYRVFVDGVKEFYNDMKRYLKISKIVNESQRGLKALNRKELELYMQMPKDMLKVAPALISCSLPMVGYAAMALVFMYPKTFLTSHFWTLQQKIQFQDNVLKIRLKNNRDVFRFLQAKITLIENADEKEKMHYILGLLGSGFHPSVDQILDVKEVFAKSPYHILSLSGKHIKLLTKMHGAPTFLFKRFRLREHAFLIHYMDLAILSEGGVHNMPHDAIRQACFLRGLNPANLSNEQMIEWLRNWIRVSTSIQADHLSLFLHLPLFLAYNHPNNWQLIYGD